jgi:nitroreductase
LHLQTTVMSTPEIINEIIRNRRSVFVAQYDTEKKVDESIIEQMLENANWAPTHYLTEPWRFTVFSGEGLKKLAEFQAELYKNEAGEKFEQSKYEKLLSNPLKASHIISIGMKRHPMDKLPETEEICSVASAVQNMQLTSSAYGVGCYWTTGGITYYENAKPFFNLEPQDKLLGFLYVAYAKGEPTQGRRKPIADKVRWVK